MIGAVFSKLENNARGPVWASFQKYYNKDEDINTALKEAEDHVNAMIASKK